MALKLTTQDRVLTLLQTRTQKQAARKLGVSDRTVRRWKNEGVEPTRPHAKTLTHESGRERTRLRAQARRDGFEPPDIPVQLPARRQMRLDPRDPQRKRRIPSDTVMYGTEKVRPDDVLALLRHYRKKNVAFRVIYEVPPGKPDSARRVSKRRRHVSTAWESIQQSKFQTDDGTLDYMQDIRQNWKILHVVVTDPMKRKRTKHK